MASKQHLEHPKTWPRVRLGPRQPFLFPGMLGKCLGSVGLEAVNAMVSSCFFQPL